jgi:hypothetical protein
MGIFSIAFQLLIEPNDAVKNFARQLILIILPGTCSSFPLLMEAMTGFSSWLDS